jgi:hypothetical protein
MAEILEDHNFSRNKTRSIYPYDEWLDGRIWKLLEGTDYEASLESLRACIYAAAKRRGVMVQTSAIMDGAGIVVQANKKWRPLLAQFERLNGVGGTTRNG